MYNSVMPAAAFPPPPITASVHAMNATSQSGGQSAIRLTPPNNVSDDMLLLQRRERELQGILQDLLDSQAEGLMAGLGADAVSEVMSNGSMTPTSSFRDPNSPSASPYAGSRMLSPRPKRKLGLGSARKEIYRRILDCAAVKNEEDLLVQADSVADQEVLAKLQTWEDKREGLVTRITQIEHDDSAGKRMESMRCEAKTLANEISELEIRLLQLKQRHKALEKQMVELSNRTDCELASWKSSLGILDRDIDRFLAHPPVRRDQEGSDGAATPFLTLPAHRRTLAMAREHWQGTTAASARQRKLIRRDKKALEDGAVVWKAVVTEITTFERTLRVKTSSKQADETLEALSQAMDKVIETVETHFDNAKTKKWNLLVVAVGSELEALKQGKEMLQQSMLANTTLLEDDNDLQKADSARIPGRMHQRTRSATDGHANGGGLEASSMVGVAVPRTPAARTFSNPSQNQRAHEEEQHSSPLLADAAALNPHSAALHESMYEDEDPDPDLLMGKVTDTETDTE